MKQIIKKSVLKITSLAVIITLTACGKLDVIGDTSIKSFDKILKIIPDKITEDQDKAGYSLEAPDGSARFIWSNDYSKTQYDVLLELDATPFINAGLDTNKLPDGMFVNEKIILGTDLGSDQLTYKNEVTPLESYKQIVSLYRNHITYHEALDHYGVDLTNGNVFEWAKDMTKNDKDIVFVLNPQVFIDAGVDPNKVEGWVFAKVEVMGKGNEMTEVDKLLKPFELDGSK